jgi:predicted house-cleaning noncanonical NTP pyrophosphatase (MazG superfamily)
MKVIFNKLVRDKIQELLENKNYKVSSHKLSDTEYIKELKKKLIEESEEANQAPDKDTLTKEMADIYEILDHIKQTLNISEKEITDAKNQKSQKNGSFKEKIYITHIEGNKENPNNEYFYKDPIKYKMED